jgi:hypothetical protein
MITFPIEALRQVARRRPAGYLDDVLSLASVEGEMVSLTDEAYESLKTKYASPPPTSGPGTELKKLLKTIGIEAKPGCKCNKRAQTMDEKGCDWCAENLDTISSWLQEEAERRNLPYVPSAGKLLIKWAISRARKGNKQQGD